ncbi:MAG: thioredoxin, partial [Leptolinea sp.]
SSFEADMSNLPFIQSTDFSTRVEKSELPVLLDFNAEWCVPCKRMAPILEKLADDWAGKAVFYQIDADESADLTTKFGVMSIPTVIMLKAGKEVQRTTGLQNREKLVELFSAHL